jgi:hypothetical protein
MISVLLSGPGSEASPRGSAFVVNSNFWNYTPESTCLRKVGTFLMVSMK